MSPEHFNVDGTLVDAGELATPSSSAQASWPSSSIEPRCSTSETPARCLANAEELLAMKIPQHDRHPAPGSDRRPTLAPVHAELDVGRVREHLARIAARG